MMHCNSLLHILKLPSALRAATSPLTTLRYHLDSPSQLITTSLLASNCFFVPYHLYSSVLSVLLFVRLHSSSDSSLRSISNFSRSFLSILSYLQSTLFCPPSILLFCVLNDMRPSFAQGREILLDSPCLSPSWFFFTGDTSGISSSITFPSFPSDSAFRISDSLALAHLAAAHKN